MLLYVLNSQARKLPSAMSVLCPSTFPVNKLLTLENTGSTVQGVGSLGFQVYRNPEPQGILNLKNPKPNVGNKTKVPCRSRTLKVQQGNCQDSLSLPHAALLLA